MDQCYAPSLAGRQLPLHDLVQWNPDGTHVTFTHGRNVYVAAVDGTRVRQLVDPAPRGYGGSQPGGSADRIGQMSVISVSPDGANLVYSTCEYPEPERASRTGGSPLTERDFQYDIALVPVDGGEPRRLTNHRAYDNYPVWSPDGTRIAFLSARNLDPAFGSFLRPHLYTMAPDGSDVRRLSDGLTWVVNHSPQWSPDGERLAFVAVEGSGETRAQNLYTIRADGTNLRRLGPAISGPSWSPDGRRLAFA